MQAELRPKISKAKNISNKQNLIKYDNEELKDPYVLQQYQESINEKLNEIPINLYNDDVNKYWNKCKNVKESVGENVLRAVKPNGNSYKSDGWFDAECKDIIHHKKTSNIQRHKKQKDVVQITKKGRKTSLQKKKEDLPRTTVF